MPPKAKFTREDIIKATLQLVRKKGIDAVAAREIGKCLGTSSSPIFTAFKNMDELHIELRKAAMREFEKYVSNAKNHVPIFKYVGIKMIEFAVREPKLFQVLYMQEHEQSQTFEDFMTELGDTAELCLEVLQKDYSLTRRESEQLFRLSWMHTFAICVLVAGKVCHFSQEEISEMMSIEFQGALMLIKSGKFKVMEVNPTESKE